MPHDFGELQRAALATSLRRCRLFSDLSVEELNQIASSAVQKRLNRGEYLFKSGSPFEGFYVVQQGTISLHQKKSAGQSEITHLFRTDESFAQAALAGETAHPEEAQAVEQAIVVLIPKTAFVKLLEGRPEFALHLFGSMSRRLQKLEEQVNELTLRNVQTRFIGWLLKRCRRPLEEKAVVMPLGRTKAALAAEFGISAETLTQMLVGLRREKLITLRGGTIKLLKPLALEQLFKRNIGDA